MARLEGFEPPTYWFVARHSIRLSYKRIHTAKVCYHDSFKKSTRSAEKIATDCAPQKSDGSREDAVRERTKRRSG